MDPTERFNVYQHFDSLDGVNVNDAFIDRIDQCYHLPVSTISQASSGSSWAFKHLKKKLER